MDLLTVCSTADELKAKYMESDPWRLAKALSVPVQREPLGKEDDACKGFLLRLQSVAVITVNSDLSTDMQRIILAHELGHAVLHKDGLPFTAYHDFSLFDTVSRTEYEANLFAAELLLEDADVLSELNNDGFFFSAAARLRVPPELLDFKFRILKHRGVQLEAPLCAAGDFLKKIKSAENRDF